MNKIIVIISVCFLLVTFNNLFDQPIDGFFTEFALLTTDNQEIIEDGGGILWTSEVGIHFNSFEKGFHRINQYTTIDMNEVADHYKPYLGEFVKFERPQILLRNGKPNYLFVSSGSNISEVLVLIG